MKYLYLIWSLVVCLYFVVANSNGLILSGISAEKETPGSPRVHHK